MYKTFTSGLNQAFKKIICINVSPSCAAPFRFLCQFSCHTMNAFKPKKGGKKGRREGGKEGGRKRIQLQLSATTKQFSYEMETML